MNYRSENTISHMDGEPLLPECLPHSINTLVFSNDQRRKIVFLGIIATAGNIYAQQTADVWLTDPAQQILFRQRAALKSLQLPKVQQNNLLLPLMISRSSRVLMDLVL